MSSGLSIRRLERFKACLFIYFPLNETIFLMRLNRLEAPETLNSLGNSLLR